MSQRDVIIIVGPTGIGKTDLSLILARNLDGEIVSADSRQVYIYMDIGTAKPNQEQRQQAIHYFIDIKYPHEYYSAGKYGKQARTVIDDILKRKKFPIVVGGSGLYIKALVDGFFEAEISDPKIKLKLEQEVKQSGLLNLYQKLQKVDPVIAGRLHPNDSQRILRALEVWEITGSPLSQFQQQKDKSANFKPLFIGLNMERQSLYRRINKRVDAMIQQGLIDEVNHLKEMGYTDEFVSLQTVGYTEVFEYLRGSISYEKMIDLIKQKSRNYAKRQLTWFRRDNRIKWFEIDEFMTMSQLAIEVERNFDLS